MVVQKWSVLSEMMACLKPVYQATVVMQQQDFKLSDFYASWIYMDVKLRKCIKKHNTTSLAENLLKMLDKRKPQLLDNPVLISSLALDPRFSSELDEDRIQIAVTTLAGLWAKLQLLKDSQRCGDAECSLIESDDNSSFEDDITLSNTTILKDYWKQKSKLPTTQVHPVDIQASINTFANKEHQIPEGTITDYWNSKQSECPELYALAKVIFAISPTQAMVERSFSTMGYVFNERRSMLSKQMLEDILIISLNSDLFYKNNIDELESL